MVNVTDMSTDFLTEVNAYVAETGMSPSYFGRCACGNTELVERLSAGKTVTLKTVDSVRSFMEFWRSKQAEKV